jgi:hypothetical protein
MVILLIPALFICSITLQAQKKLTLATQSEMTGIQLPEGSKKDGRFLSEITGKILLELESKKAATKISKLEMLVLPPTAQTNFTADSLVGRLSAVGWNIVQVNDDTKFVWIQKEARYLMAYFSMDKKDAALYFGEPETPPVFQPVQ